MTRSERGADYNQGDFCYIRCLRGLAVMLRISARCQNLDQDPCKKPQDLAKWTPFVIIPPITYVGERTYGLKVHYWCRIVHFTVCLPELNSGLNFSLETVSKPLMAEDISLYIHPYLIFQRPWSPNIRWLTEVAQTLPFLPPLVDMKSSRAKVPRHLPFGSCGFQYLAMARNGISATWFFERAVREVMSVT